MYGALKDVAVIIDGEDPLVDAVQAGVALRLAHHHGAHVKVFEQGGADRLGQLAWIDDLELPPYAGVEICGISHEPPMGRHGLRSPLSELLHEARQSGHWGKRAETNELLQALRCTDLVVAHQPDRRLKGDSIPSLRLTPQGSPGNGWNQSPLSWLGIILTAGDGSSQIAAVLILWI